MPMRDDITRCCRLRHAMPRAFAEMLSRAMPMPRRYADDYAALLPLLICHDSAICRRRR